MPFDFTNTHTLLMAVQQLTPPVTFLRDRFFPTNDATDLFATDDVLIEYKDGSKRLAPFVAPRKGGVTILRDGSEMSRYTPPNIAPQRSLTSDDLQKRGFGEALYSQLTPEQRQSVLLLRDATEMSQMISRREEAMAAEVLLTNGCIMKHIADDPTKSDDKEIHFYSEAQNPAKYIKTTPNWNLEAALIIDDVTAMSRYLAARGLPAADLVVAPDVGAAILNNAKIQKLLDLRNYSIGAVQPMMLPDGAALLATLNFQGRMINIISYDETYEDANGATVQFIPAGYAVLTAPGAGRTLYGAVSQVEQADGLFHTYMGRRVPKYLSNAQGNTRSLTVTSCPLLIPNNKNPWITIQAITY